MPEWEGLISMTICDYMTSQANHIENNLKLLAFLRSAEEIERNRQYWEREQKRLAAIEAAKSPAQRLREKQAACSHNFKKRGDRHYCTICKLRPSKDFVQGYELGKERADCDCY